MAWGLDVSLTFEEALLLDRIMGLESQGYPHLFSLVKKYDLLWTAQGADPNSILWVPLGTREREAGNA